MPPEEMLSMGSDLPPSTREPGRRGKQGETRARLVQVTIELVRKEGLGALTTSRITRAAGIAQPGFYAHFKNVEELLRTAVSQVLDEMRLRSSAARRRAFERFGTLESVNDLQMFRAACEDTLEVFLSDPGFADLFLRYRRDPSLLGGYMRYAMDSTRRDITDDLWSRAQLMGFREEHRPLVALWAEQLLALYFATAEALLDNRYPDRDLLLDSFSRSTHAIAVSAVQTVLGVDAAPPKGRTTRAKSAVRRQH
jgi:AcrR family transcriptional regulator